MVGSDQRDSLGRRLRAIRKSKLVSSPAALSRLMGQSYSVSGILKRERGEIKVDFEYVEAFCSALGLKGKERSQLVNLTKLFLVRFDPWKSGKNDVLRLQLDFWKYLLSCENFVEYEALAICGMLQCEAYRYEMLRMHGNDHESALHGAKQRMEQSHSLLVRGDASNGGGSLKRIGPKRIRLVTDEEALYRIVGTRQVMLSQLDWLISVTLPANIEHRILPRGTVLPVPLMYSFCVFDDSLILMEAATGAVYSSNQPSVDFQLKVFDSIFDSAIPLVSAENLISAARLYHQRNISRS